MPPVRVPSQSALFPYTPLFRSAKSLKGVRGSARLVRAAAEESHTAATHGLCDLERLLVALDGAGARDDRHLFAVESHEQARSEEHTSELQSRQYLVCRLLLEKK